VLGVVIQLLVIRPVQHRSVIAVVIVTVGLFILIDGLVTWKWGADLKFMQAPFGNKIYHAGDVAFSRQDLSTIGISLLAVVSLWALFRFTRLGLALRAAAARPDAARLVGVRVSWMLSLGWGLAAALGAVAGMMAAASPSVLLQPSMMDGILIYAFAAAVVGGLESAGGAVVAALLIGVLLNLLTTYVDAVGPALQLPVAFVVMLVVLLVRPSGLFGRTRVRRV